MMAVESDKITADVVEVSEYPHIAQRYRIYGVPKTVINDSVELEGMRPEAAIAAAVEQASRQADGPAAKSGQ